MAAHELCFPLSLVSTGSFSSKKKKGGGEAAFSGARLRHRASRFSAAPASSGCRPSRLEPLSPQQADFRRSGGLLRGRQRAGGGARGQLTSMWVQLAHPSSAICPPCLLRVLPWTLTAQSEPGSTLKIWDKTPEEPRWPEL